jgi:hypothetical protein
MKVARWRTTLRVFASLSMLSALGVGPGVVSAQELTVTPDGQQFQTQSSSTQNAFMATFGQNCAAQEWTWQHTLAIDPDSFGGDPASDGQKFTDQDDDDVQQPFVALFGTQANAEWVAEHNSVVAHRVMLGSVAPVPCPPARSAVGPTEPIGTLHLADAVDAAKTGDLGDATDGFAAFRVIWAAAKPKVTAQSAALAQSVQTAVDQVSALAGTSSGPAQVYPALQNLLRVVRGANATLLSGGAAPTTPAGVPSQGATAGPAIKANNLGEAVDWATKGDLANTRKEFGEFQDDWSKVSDAWHAANPATANAIDAAIAQLQAVIGDTSQSPAQSQYQPLIQTLQKAVQDANSLAD